MPKSDTQFSSTRQPKRRSGGSPKGYKKRITSLREAFMKVATDKIILEDELHQLLESDPKDFFKIMASLEPKKVEHGGSDDLPPIKIDFTAASKASIDDE